MSTTSAEGLNWPPPTMAIVGFDVEAINAETADHSHVDAGVFEQRFMVRARASEGKLAFGWFWLSGAVGLLLRPADQGSPWGPRYMGDGWRMPVIEDFLPQAEAFETLAAQLDHPGLKARLADIAWTNERHRGAAGRCAIDAYVDSLDRLLDGRARPRYGEVEGASFEALGFAQRALQLALRLTGKKKTDPVVDFDDMTEENVSLSAMLGRLRPQLEAILPPATVLELELLFDFRAGSALRHAVAHGRIGTGGCHTTEAVYACWLLYQLTCWPLLRTWDSITAPAIREQC